MSDAGETRDDIKLPEGDLGKEISTKFDKGEQLMLTLLGACGDEMIIACKNVKQD